MSDNVEITMSSTEKGVIQSLDSVARTLTKVEERMSAVEKASKKATDVSHHGFSEMAAEAGKFALEIVGVVSAFEAIEKVIERLKAEYEDLKRRQEGAAETQISYATAMKQLIRSSAGAADAGDLAGMVDAISLKTGAKQEQSAAALARAITSTGAKNKAGVEQAAKIATAALGLGPEMSPEDLGAVSGAAGKILEHAKGGGTAEGAVGFLMQVGRDAGIAGEEALGKHIAPAMALGTGSGMSLEESDALYSAIAHGAGDTTGRVTDSTFATLIEDLRKRYPGRNPHDVIRELQGDKKERDKFFAGGLYKGVKGHIAGAEFSAKSGETVKRLLEGGDSIEARTLREVSEKAGGLERGAETYRETQEQFAKVGAVGTLELEHAAAMRAQRAQLADLGAGETAVTREGIEKILAAEGVGLTARDIEEFGFNLQSGFSNKRGSQIVSEILGRRAHELEHPMRADIDALGLGTPTERPRPATRDELTRARRLREASRFFGEFAKERNETDEKRREQEEAAERPGASLSFNEFDAQMFARGQRSEEWRFGQTFRGPKPGGRRRVPAGELADEAEAQAGRLSHVIEERDADGQIVGERERRGGEVLPAQQQRTVDALRQIAGDIRKIREQGEKPTKVVGVGIRSEISTTSSAGVALSR
jgi:hypothetical protein